MNQLRPEEEEELSRLLRKMFGLFAESSKMVPACEEDPIRLRPRDPPCAPFMALHNTIALNKEK